MFGHEHVPECFKQVKILHASVKSGYTAARTPEELETPTRTANGVQSIPPSASGLSTVLPRNTITINENEK